jgi:PAS domain S-box-containing protein
MRTAMHNSSGEEPRIVTDTVPVAAVRCDREGRYLWVNPTYARWVSQPAKQILGLRISDVIGARAMSEIEPFVARVLAGEPVQYERLVELPGLGRRWIKWAYTPTFDAAGRIEGWVATGVDIHGAKETERKRDEFLATLAHELRNPLAPIRNAVAILGRKGPHDPEVAWSQGVIERQVEQLSRLVDDLLDIERISRGKFLLRRERVPLEVTIDMALEATRPFINAAGHHLSVLLPSERVVIDADPALLARVFATLLKNAARHMQARGSINLTATVESGAVLVRIEDSGVGIEAGAQPGVGLTLVRGILALHQAGLEIRPLDTGPGTEALVRVPIASGAVAAEWRTPRAEPAPGVPLRILVADDNRDTADSLQRVLALHGHEVRVAYDGAAALSVGEQFRPRVAILDIAMPGTNGYEVARALRSRHGAEVTLVALTGWGQDADRRRALEAGFDYHLIKPIDPNELNTLLGRLTRQ